MNSLTPPLDWKSLTLIKLEITDAKKNQSSFFYASAFDVIRFDVFFFYTSAQLCAVRMPVFSQDALP